MLKHDKILTWDQMAARREALPKGFKLVFTNGCFDILHPGHVDLLRRARAMGDALVMGLNSDDSVKRLNKAPCRPVNSSDQRAYVLAGLESIDFVVEFDQDTPYELIKLVQPDVLIKGGDWPVDKIVGRDIVEARGGTVLSLPLLPGFSTTSLLEKSRLSVDFLDSQKAGE